MPTESPVPKSSPLWKAWEEFQKTESYENACVWVGKEEHRKGSLWAVFTGGFLAANPDGAKGVPEPGQKWSRNVAHPAFQKGYMAGMDSPEYLTAKQPETVKNPYPPDTEDNFQYEEGFRQCIR